MWMDQRSILLLLRYRARLDLKMFNVQHIQQGLTDKNKTGHEGWN